MLGIYLVIRGRRTGAFVCVWFGCVCACASMCVCVSVCLCMRVPLCLSFSLSLCLPFSLTSLFWSGWLLFV